MPKVAIHAKPEALMRLYEQAQAAGCELSRSRRHVVVTTPSGERVFCTSTASDRRTVLNTRAELRRRGVAV